MSYHRQRQTHNSTLNNSFYLLVSIYVRARLYLAVLSSPFTSCFTFLVAPSVVYLLLSVPQNFHCKPHLGSCSFSPICFCIITEAIARNRLLSSQFSKCKLPVYSRRRSSWIFSKFHFNTNQTLLHLLSHSVNQLSNQAIEHSDNQAIIQQVNLIYLMN